MSGANVEIVLRLQLGPEVDFAQIVRDDNLTAKLVEAAATFVHPDVECVFPDLLGGGKTYTGADGFRAGWLDWLAPWATYRAEVEQAIDLGDRVLLLVRDFARREGSGIELKSHNAAIWTVRDGKVARAEFYPDRDQALKAAGLAD